MYARVCVYQLPILYFAENAKRNKQLNVKPKRAKFSKVAL